MGKMNLWRSFIGQCYNVTSPLPTLIPGAALQVFSKIFAGLLFFKDKWINMQTKLSALIKMSSLPKAWRAAVEPEKQIYIFKPVSHYMKRLCGDKHRHLTPKQGIINHDTK